MKRIGNLLLVSSLSLAIGVKSVSAQTFNDGDAHSLSRGNYITINSLDVGSANYGIYKYTFDNGKYVGYCEDPQNFSGKNYSVSRELGATTNGKTIQNMDAGLLKIISEGYNQYNTSKTISVVTPESAPNAISITLSGDELYAATSIAVRAYSTGLFTTGAKGAKYQSAIDMASAHANLGAQWAALYGEYTDNATYGSCNGDSNCYKNKVDYAWLNKNAMFNYSDPNSASYKIIYMAQQLFKAGVMDASNKATGSLLTTTVNIEFSKKSESITKTDTSEEKYVYATLKIENLPEKLSDGKEGKVELSMPTCTGCTINSFEAQDGGDYKQVGIGNNIALLLEAKDGVRTGEIKLRIKVTQAVQDQENCKDATAMVLKEDYYSKLSNDFHAGYNIQNLVSSGLITMYGVFQDCSDQYTLIPMNDLYFKYYGSYPINECADSGYGIYENYKYIQKHNIGNYIKFITWAQEAEEKKPQLFYTFEDGVLCLNTCIGEEVQFNSSHHQRIKKLILNLIHLLMM